MAEKPLTVRMLLLKLLGYDWDVEPTAVPATEGVLFAETIYVQTILLYNSAGSDVTVTIKDNQSTPKTYFAKSIATNDILVINFVKPLKFRNGIRHVASATGVYIAASGYK